MTLDVSYAEYAGGGPGFVLVRVAGRARAAARARVAPPALLIADAGSWRRLATVAGTPPLPASPEGTGFAVDFEVPLHLAAAEGGWWLEPGPRLADDLATAPLDALRARVGELGAEIAALRERLAADADAADANDAATRPAPAADANDAATRPAPVAVPRPRLRALRPTLPALLVAAGALAVGDAVATVVWQEPLSALWAARQQHALTGDLARLDATFATPAAATALPPSPDVRMRALARTLEHTTTSGRPIGELRIPRIDAKYVVVQGTGTGALRRGPGHYAGTALPGQPGTVGIAGHRTTYGAPFRHLDALRRGDAIDVTMPYGRFLYRVEATRIVKPEDVSSLRAIGRQRLALTACHPLYSAAKRLVVLADLERVTPRGAAATGAAARPPRGAGGAAAQGPQA